jgi:hypothetical protein
VSDRQPEEGAFSIETAPSHNRRFSKNGVFQTAQCASEDETKTVIFFLKTTLFAQTFGADSRTDQGNGRVVVLD